MPMHGDFYAGKGIGHAVLQTSAGLLSVFNTHTCANYSHKYKGGNACLCAAVYFATLLLIFWHESLHCFMLCAPSLLACIPFLRLLATSLCSILYGINITLQAAQSAFFWSAYVGFICKVCCCSATLELDMLIVTEPCTECCLQSQLRTSNAGSLQIMMQPYASHRCCSLQAWCKLLSNRCIICNLSLVQMDSYFAHATYAFQIC